MTVDSICLGTILNRTICEAFAICLPPLLFLGLLLPFLERQLLALGFA